VRNVASAIDLLATDTDGRFDAVDRFDQMNALLQIMKTRWETRGIGKTKTVQYTLNDVNKSVSAVERSFEAMDKLSAELKLSGTDWPSRRDFLEKTLVHPLRSYRQQLEALHLKQKQRTDELISRKKDDKADRAAQLMQLGN
jgi:hypothetical protein